MVSVMVSSLEVDVLDIGGKVLRKASLSSGVFGFESRPDIVQRVVLWQMARSRSGCHYTKGRSDVVGSTRKIYKQKGTGGARHGDKKANIFVGGGVVFGPKVRDYSHKLNKKVRSLGIKVALSDKLRAGELMVVESMSLPSHKTKDFCSALRALLGSDAKNQKVLFVDEDFATEFVNASSNVVGFDVLPVCGINVRDVVASHKLIVTERALKVIERRFGV